MANHSYTVPAPLSIGSALKSFVFPLRRKGAASLPHGEPKVSAIIPTYAPSPLTLRLVEDLLRWNPHMRVYVVDDCSPEDRIESAELLRNMAELSPRVMLLRTPENKLKAGALNYALAHIAHEEYAPDVVLTLDDDVVVAEQTVRNIVGELMSDGSLGAVCSACKVFNKNKNLLTRLQGLEYLGFNAIRLADEGFIRGPLVMHGMLTAFRASALREAGGFSEGHLIEDYEVTTRLKERGWHVRTALHAPAWTVVPETLSRLWRQRTRWSYGGITVVAGARRASTVFQDLLGHAIFISMLLLVFALFFSKGGGLVPPLVAQWIIALSLFQLAVTYAFQVWLMRQYEERDTYDWLIRILLLPEFVYGYLMTVALLGSYIFHSFVTVKRKLPAHSLERMTRVFHTLGYAERMWGTRQTKTL